MKQNTAAPKSPRLFLLRDFDIHMETQLSGASLKFMNSLAAVGMSQHSIGPMLLIGHILDLAFRSGQRG